MAHYCPPENRKWVIVVAFLASAMGFIDGTIVAIALPQIRAALDAGFAEAQWFHNAYILLLSAFILLGGGLGDRFGIKSVFAVGLIFFTAMSVLCAFAWDPATLIAFRALQGAGAAIMLPGSMALIARNTPREERGTALGIWVASSSITTAMGPFLGGFLLTYGGADAWRLIFAINLPLGLLALGVLWKFVPTDPPKEQGGLAGLDWTGAALLTLAMGLLATGLTFLGEGGGGTATLLLLAGLTLSVIAVRWELRLKEPMIDMRLFKSAEFCGANAVTFLIWSCMGAVTFFLPMLIIVAWQLPPSYAGSMFLPFSILITILSPFAGRLVDRYGTRLLLTLGSVIFAIGCAGFALAIIAQDFWAGILPAFAIIGLSLGLMGATVAAAVMNAVDEEKTGTASGINNMLARLSFLFAVAGLGAFVSFGYAQVVRAGSLDPLVQELMLSAGFGERLEGALYQVATVKLQAVAMNHAMIALFILLAAMSLIAAAIAWFSQPRRAAAAVTVS